MFFRTAGSILGTGVNTFISDWDRVTAAVRTSHFFCLYLYLSLKYFQDHLIPSVVILGCRDNSFCFWYLCREAGNGSCGKVSCKSVKVFCISVQVHLYYFYFSPRYIEAKLGKPSLIRETSRLTAAGAIRHPILVRFKSCHIT